MGRWLNAGRLLALACLPTLAALAVPAEAASRPKVIIMTDIGQDPDDQQSLVRTLLYANSIDIRGLIATYIPRDRPVQPGLITATIDA
jgi:purine nucleoside permease